MCIAAYYVMEKFYICLFCFIGRWCSFLVFMFQDGFVSCYKIYKLEQSGILQKFYDFSDCKSCL